MDNFQLDIVHLLNKLSSIGAGFSELLSVTINWQHGQKALLPQAS